ncbi:DNA polymerase alpha catalytic subunit [Tanacetum coccineum]
MIKAKMSIGHNQAMHLLPKMKEKKAKAAAALMGKQGISNLFSNYKSKVCNDSVIDDVLAEFTPDENDGRGIKRVVNNETAFAPSRFVKPVNVESVDECEVKDEVVVKEGGVWSLNAKVKEVKDLTFSATAGLQMVVTASAGLDGDVESSLSSDGKYPFVVDSDASLPFYMLDAYEEYFSSNAGNIYLFGKVKAGSTYHSCCVIVKNMQRCIYAIPSDSVIEDPVIAKLEKDVKDSNMSPTAFHTKLHEMASGLKTNVTKLLLDRNLSNFSMKPVKRNYAVERSDIGRKEHYVLNSVIHSRTGHFLRILREQPSVLCFEPVAVFSCTYMMYHVRESYVHLNWMRCIQCFGASSYLKEDKGTLMAINFKVSWCKFEVIVERSKNIKVATNPENTREISLVIVTAINLKTVINQKHNMNEIAFASVVYCHEDKLEDGLFPMGFSKEAADKNSKAGSNIISTESSERALLAKFLAACGRLLCDTLLCSRDRLKEVSYSLTELAKSLLFKNIKEIAPHDIPQLFQSSQTLMELSITDVEISCIEEVRSVVYKGIGAFALGCPNLVEIRVTKFRHVTREVRDWLKARRGSVVVIGETLRPKLSIQFLVTGV